MPDMTFNTPEGQTIERELLIACLNTGTESAPVWSPFGARVEDSSMEYDWSDESKQDILGKTRNTMRKPKITQSFDPSELDPAEPALMKIWNLAVRDQDASALAAQDVLVVHAYAGTAKTAVFAERYDASMVKPTGLGGSSVIEMPIEVTYGGNRTTGTAAISATGEITFTAD